MAREGSRLVVEYDITGFTAEEIDSLALDALELAGAVEASRRECPPPYITLR